MNSIIIKGAREHNLKNIDLTLPRDSLIVISGLSGSGKSSLAFDTIFAEGQRRYVESLSAYARQFLGRLDKPDLDYIEGLSPAISIEQKSQNRNPRSTVGTITEIWDYYRLLFARIGIPHDPLTGKPIEKQTVDEIIEKVFLLPVDSKLTVLATMVSGRKGEHQRIFTDAKKLGFIRVRVNGEIMLLEDNIALEKQKKHNIDIVVDRIKVTPKARKRIVEAIETAIELTDGTVLLVRDETKEEIRFSQYYAYSSSNISFSSLEPRFFSFNSPFGACPTCHGLGMRKEFDINLLIPDASLSFEQHAIRPINPESKWFRTQFEALAEALDFSLAQPLNTLSDDVMQQILYGSKKILQFTYTSLHGKMQYERKYPGVIPDLERRYRETTSNREWYETFMCEHFCPACKGERLRPEALAVRINGKGIQELAAMTVSDTLHFFDGLKLSGNAGLIASDVLKEIKERLRFMENVGLDYLSMNRTAATLSGGESQRIRLATQIGSQLVGVLYVLDEPTIGLHQKDNERLLHTLMKLRDLGNTLIVVEHDEQTLRSADYIVDLGPGAGIHGGSVIGKGTPQEIMQNTNSVTGKYLSGAITVSLPKKRRKGKNRLSIVGAREHNLKNITADFLLGALNVITGVSGSGKSTLLSHVLFPALSNKIGRTRFSAGAFRALKGYEHIDKIINIDQSPIGRTPRSNPATYVKMFDAIRSLFATLPESKARAYKPGRFSFNVPGGRCEHCQGAGTIKVEMHFLSDVYVQCEVCKGRRFTTETLDILYKGKNIADVLSLSVEEAKSFFAAIPAINRRLQTLSAVGLDYITLGQSALTFSGGEAQRIKLSLELSKKGTGKTLYILDEPTTGLHFADVAKLLEVLHLLVEKGNTVILIEHNIDVIIQADHIIDLGPEGGYRGGYVIGKGTPEEIMKVKKSYTGQFVAQAMARRSHEISV